MGSMQRVLFPPAQLTVNTPSSSESRFILIFPRRLDVSMFFAPSIPVSSSVVKTASTGGLLLSESRSASIMATAIPSSAPSVVPTAEILSPSTARSIPSFSTSLVQSGAFSQTISRCPARSIGSALSQPTAGAKIMQLLLSSCKHLKP